ncbi:MAG: CoA transferase [SAR324 cluster bacterium]|jgi:crotonobetainyl-CoA:carnitine CoA-transferase CaiB-like acyl-CoA transferase|nr:CoA transferase [Deltaproteobacteria bacterium]MDP6094166.1 CoA transferase [SAR324 cluster bacterium]MDP6245619.1 CoA transferase [SAR324 cluster bacterium]MDP6465807.1 CoA transferase [SAR324 cluster bacterium]MDP7137839.1 CoA transferase [SAR324 cluster bacterium]|tara:strand:- start:439 stop:1626 length:1188 start_codon:yes stop_codon:yes gene_type:complete
MTLPLKGVRVLAVEQYGAGPFGTQFLADQGAEVVKIENPNDGGDFARNVGPFFFTPEHSEFFHAYNRNKKSLTLDLSQKEGLQVFQDLVKTSDAVASNLRGDVPEKLGLTYEALGAINEKIVCAHLSAYGRKGPRASWPGFDYMMQAEAGYFSLTGEPDAPPTRFGLSVVDQMTGLALAYAVLAGITGARSSGRGRDLDVSLFDVALCNLGYPAIWYLNEGHRTGRLERSAHPALTPCELYRTSDGWIYIMCNKEKFWPVLCEVLGHDEWSTDGRFKDFKGRLEHRKLIREMLDEELQKKNTSDWLKIFAGKVPAAPVNDLQGALENPFVQDEGRIQSIPLKDYGSYRTLDSPVKCGEPTPSNPAPLLGQDTEQLLTDLGYSPDHITELRDSGII